MKSLNIPGELRFFKCMVINYQQYCFKAMNVFNEKIDGTCICQIQRHRKCFQRTYFCALTNNVKSIHEKYALATLNIIFNKLDNMYYFKRYYFFESNFMINIVKHEKHTKLKKSLKDKLEKKCFGFKFPSKFVIVTTFLFE